MHKLLLISSTVLALLIGFVLGLNTQLSTANALMAALTAADTQYTIPLTMTLQLDENGEQTTTVPLVLTHSLRLESPSSTVLSIQTANATITEASAPTTDNIGIPYDLTAPDGIQITWLMREFDDMAVLEGVVTNVDTDDSRVIDSLIVAATFYDLEGDFLVTEDMQPVPYRESELPSATDVTFEIYSGDDAPFADIGSYTIHVQASYGDPERRRGD